MLGRFGKIVTRPFDRAVQWFLPPPATERQSPECIEMRPLADLRRQTYATVSFEDLQVATAREDWASAATARETAPSPPPLLLSVLHDALELLAKPFKSKALWRAYTAEQRFLARRVCSRFERVLWIGLATLLWGVLLALVSACGLALALTGDLGKFLGENPRIWFVKFGTYLTSYFTVLHVAQLVCALLLLIAVKIAETSPRIDDPTEEEFLLWLWSLGFPTVARVTRSRVSVSSPSENPPALASLSVPSPERTSVVLQVQAQVEHNPDGQRPTAYTRSPSSVRTREPVAPIASTSTSRSPEAAQCVGSPSSSAAGTSNTAGEQETMRRKGSSLDKILQSLIEELQDEKIAETSNDKPSPKRVRLRTPWLWVSALTLASYTTTAVALYCTGSVAIPTTLCAITDLERLIGTGPSYESTLETGAVTGTATGQRVTATSPRENAQGDRPRPDSPSSRLNEGTCLLRFK